MALLALDIANKTGFKTKEASGTWDLAPKRGESSGMSVVRFRAKLAELAKLCNRAGSPITVIAAELPVGMHKASLISMGKKHGIMEEFAITNNIVVAMYTPGEIKKAATGKGNCNKAAMISACIDKYGIEPIDDNEADAVHLYHLASADLGLA